MPPSRQELDRQRFSRMSGLLVATALTGYATYLVDRATLWEQWAYLVHTVQGLALVGVLLHFTYVHYRRTVGLRRAGTSFTGMLAVLVTGVFLWSGVHLTVFGQTQSTRYVLWTHIVSATVGLLFVAFHVIWHRWTLSAERRSAGQRLLGVEGRTSRQVGRHVVLALALIALGRGAYALLPSPYVDDAVVKPYTLPYGDNPYAPSHNRTASGGFYDVKRLGGAADCGVCHAEIFEEWQSSMHAKAGADPAYQRNVKNLASSRGMAAARYCEGCHSPVPMMSGQLSAGGRLDTHGHLHEGISCLSCHAIRAVLDTSGVASYLYEPPAAMLFAGYENGAARRLRHYLIQINPSLHRRDMARAPLRTPELCASCHAQFMEKIMNDWGWVKMQDDYTAWLKSPFSGQSNHTFAEATLKRCQDCHFPLVSGRDPSATGGGLQRSHRTPGANTAIPFVDGDLRQVEYQTRFLQANRIAVSIDKPTRPQAMRSDKPIQADISDVTETPGYFYLGDDVTINTVVANIGVGHEFPGGTTDINEVWVHFVVRDGQDRMVFESGGTDESGDVDPKAYFYRSLPVDKEGKLVWRHDLFRMVGDSFKNTISPGAADVVTYHFKVPGWVKNPLNVSAVVKYRKFNNRYARWALQDDDIVLPVVDVASDSISIPVRERIEAADANRRQEAHAPPTVR